MFWSRSWRASSSQAGSMRTPATFGDLPVAATSAATAIAAIPAAAAAAVTASPSTAAETSAAARLALACLVDRERPAVERLTVHLGDRRLRVLVASELYECETARLPCHSIRNDTDADDFTPPGGARLTKR